MRAGAEVGEIVLRIDGDALAFGHGIQQFDFVRLLQFGKNLTGFFAGDHLALEAGGLLDDALHLLLDGVEVGAAEGLAVEIVEKATVGRRSDGEFGVGVKMFDGLSHDVRGRMPQDRQRLWGILVQQLNLAILTDRVAQVNHLAVNLGSAEGVEHLGVGAEDEINDGTGSFNSDLADSFQIDFHNITIFKYGLQNYDFLLSLRL